MKQKKGFTLIEVIVVLAVIALALPALFNIVFALMRQQVKLYQLSEVKRQGDYALSLMENTIRNTAGGITDAQVGGNPLCDTIALTPTPVVYFVNNNDSNRWFNYTLNSNRISSNSAVPGASSFLTSNTVTISNFSMTCTRSATYSTPVVNINYDVSVGSPGIRAEERAQMNYKTRIKLKTY